MTSLPVSFGPQSCWGPYFEVLNVMGNDASKAARPRGGTGGALTLESPGSSSGRPPSSTKGSNGVSMRVVLRGARGSGKTSLFRRLKGEPFATDYAPSKEIDVATISWSESRLIMPNY